MHLELAEVGLGQRIDDRARVLFERAAFFVDELRQANQLLVLRRITVGLDDLLAGHRRRRAPAHLVVGDRLLELHHDDGAAREVDAERNAALDAVDEAGDDDRSPTGAIACQRHLMKS